MEGDGGSEEGKSGMKKREEKEERGIYIKVCHSINTRYAYNV